MEQYLRSLPFCDAVIVNDNSQNSNPAICQMSSSSSQVEKMPRLTSLTIHDARRKSMVKPRRARSRRLLSTTNTIDALVGSRWSIDTDHNSTASNFSPPRRRLSDDFFDSVAVPCLEDVTQTLDSSLAKSEEKVSYSSKHNDNRKAFGTTKVNVLRKRGSMQTLSKEAIRAAMKSLDLLIFDSDCDEIEVLVDDASDHSTVSAQCAYSIHQTRRKLFHYGHLIDSIVVPTNDVATIE